MIGILYESDEWSDWKLHDELVKALDEPVLMINMEDADAVQTASECEMLISRVFASAQFRGHARSHENMERACLAAAQAGIPMLNPARAHSFEISKARAAHALAKSGFSVPCVIALGTPDILESALAQAPYPCIIKPDCGGRTTHTAVLHDQEAVTAFLREAPQMEFIVEEYVQARAGFMTRVELAGGTVVLTVKRSIAANGLSSYHEGSVYEMYPECCPALLAEAERAAAALGIVYGSFDIIEGADGRNYFIDANSVSNVSEDCTDLFEGFDLMRVHARHMAEDIQRHRARHGSAPPTQRVSGSQSGKEIIGQHA